MKKLIVFILFVIFPAVSWSANVTQTQVKQAQKASQDLLQATNDLYKFTNYVNNLFDDNFKLSLFGSTSTVTIPTTTKNELIDIQKYNVLKQNIVNAFNDLP